MKRRRPRMVFSALCALSLSLAVGCGGSANPGTSGSSSSERTSNTLPGAFVPKPGSLYRARKCATAFAQYETIGRDFGQISPRNHTAAINKTVADAANLKTTMAEIAPTASPGQQAQIEQYSTVLTQTQQALKVAESGRFQAATSQLASVLPQFQALPRFLIDVCKP